MMRSTSELLAADEDSALGLLRRLFADYGYPYRGRYAAAFALMAISAVCTAGTAYLIGTVVNTAYVDRNFPGIVLLCGAVMALFAVKGLSTYGHAVILARIGNRVIAENQRRLFAKLLDENLTFFAKRHSSEFIARLNAGAVAASQLLNLVITAAGRDLLSLIGLLAVMAIQDPWMSLVTLLVAPPAILVLRQLIRRVRRVAVSQFVGGARILETVQETLHGIRIVKAFTLEDEMRKRIAADIAEVESASNKMARVANRSSPLMESLGGVAIAFAILYSGYRVVYAGAAPGEFISFMAAFLLAYEPAKRLARLNIDVSGHLVGVRMLFEVVDSPATEAKEPGKPDLALTETRVTFDDVRFSYRAEEPAIRGLSFTAEPGRMTALVGPSGGGKSTILNLILRLYEPDAGAILIDGQDIAETARASVRRQIAYVGQEVFLFRSSIRDNIAFGRPGADDAAIVAAAKAAYAHDFIMGFPQGYDTPVGEHGLQLSGGQRQRVAIARALVKDARIILLDEATAALDSESEREVQRAIATLCENRTTIVVAHRLATITHADRILVIEDGRLVDTGRHEELLRRGGRYASFYRLQLQQQTGPHPLPVAVAH